MQLTKKMPSSENVKQKKHSNDKWTDPTPMNIFFNTHQSISPPAYLNKEMKDLFNDAAKTSQ